MMETKKCDVCGFDKCGASDDDRFDYCSEFCAIATPAQIEEFKTLKPGDFGFYFCAGCGGAIEDEFYPGGFCSSSSCRAARLTEKISKAYALLRQAQEAQSEAGNTSEAFRLMDEAAALLNAG